MDEQLCSNDESHSEKLTTELPEYFCRLDYKLFERTYPGLHLPPETQDLFDEAAKTIKPPEERDLNPIPKINLDDRNIMDRVRFNGKGIQIDLGPAGAVAAVLGMLLVGAAGGESERTREAEREAQEARRAQEQERLAREEAEREAEEARRVQEQERLAREEAERKEKLERGLREL